MAFPLGTLYHGSKFAVEGLSEALQYELASIGVRVKIVEPGFMNTDFGGRSLDFNNDVTLTEYQPLIKSVFDVLGPMAAHGSAPEIVAEVVYAATIDESDQLRYEAGADAVQMIATRRASDDATLFAGFKSQFGVPVDSGPAAFRIRA